MDFVKWISDHKEWLFDGFGGALILAVIGWIIAAVFSKPSKAINQKQRGGIGSSNTQIGSVKIENKSDE
jgi:hypothetical protein